MIFINHGFSGIICERVLAPVLDRVSPLSARARGWAFLLGATMPDVDILTKVLAGRGAYFSGIWYGHRAASHSLLGTLLLACAAALLLYRPIIGRRQAGVALGTYLWLVLMFWLGGVIHLLGDFFTPGWPMPIFWPAEVRYGAMSHIGWFTPYLLWLFMATVLIGWGLHLLARHWPKLMPLKPGALWLLYSVAAWRWVSFMVQSRYESRSQWAQYQFDLLPDSMVIPITRGVSFLWHWLTG